MMFRATRPSLQTLIITLSCFPLCHRAYRCWTYCVFCCFNFVCCLSLPTRMLAPWGQKSPSVVLTAVVLYSSANRAWRINVAQKLFVERMSKWTNKEFSQIPYLTAHRLSWSLLERKAIAALLLHVERRGLKRLISLSFFPCRDLFLSMSMQLLVRRCMELLIQYRRLQIYVRNITYGYMSMLPGAAGCSCPGSTATNSVA